MYIKVSQLPFLWSRIHVARLPPIWSQKFLHRAGPTDLCLSAQTRNLQCECVALYLAAWMLNSTCWTLVLLTGEQCFYSSEGLPFVYSSTCAAACKVQDGQYTYHIVHSTVVLYQTINIASL